MKENVLLKVMLKILIMMIACLLLMLYFSSCTHSYASHTSVLGLEVDWRPESISPSIRLGYINHDGAVVAPKAKAKVSKRYSDINMVQCKGKIQTELEVDCVSQDN